MMPNVIRDNALIIACDKGQQPEQALELFQAVQRQGMMPNMITCSALISACDKGP